MKKYLYDNFTAISANSLSLTVSTLQPYLKDHDVGMPLFGTVLSLEAMAEGRDFLTADFPVHCIKNISSGKDCLFTPVSTNELLCTISGPDISVSYNNELIFSCEMYEEVFEKPITLPPVLFKEISDHPMAIGKDIYSCLFHGPSLQVLSKVSTFEKYIVSEMNSQLPPLSVNSDGAFAILPIRVIEFCLQSCGMWELAFSKCVSVPLSIEQINIYDDFYSTPIYAIAEMLPNGGHIIAVDKDGSPLVEVIGYKTKQMPYEGGNFEELQKKF